jgi:hypothetical protein
VARRCLWCKGPTPPHKISGKPRAFCSVRCNNAAAKARYMGRRSAPRRVNTAPVPYGEDLKGRTFGQLTVEDGHARLRVRCSCGAVEERARHSLISAGRKGCVPACAACVMARISTSVAAKAPGATNGVCSWCPRPSVSMTKGTGPAFECEPCNRRAQRNGRDADGRPIYRSKVAP